MNITNPCNYSEHQPHITIRNYKRVAHTSLPQCTHTNSFRSLVPLTIPSQVSSLIALLEASLAIAAGDASAISSLEALPTLETRAPWGVLVGFEIVPGEGELIYREELAIARPNKANETSRFVHYFISAECFSFSPEKR